MRKREIAVIIFCGVLLVFLIIAILNERTEIFNFGGTKERIADFEKFVFFSPDNCVDGDGDGYYKIDADCSIGDDCDDANEDIHPDAVEICFYGGDEDCDGVNDNGCIEPDVERRASLSAQSKDSLRIWFYSDSHLASDWTNRDWDGYFDSVLEGMDGKYDYAFFLGDVVDNGLDAKAFSLTKQAIDANDVSAITSVIGGNHDCGSPMTGVVRPANLVSYLYPYLSFEKRIGNIDFMAMSDECRLNCDGCGASWISDETMDWFEGNVIENQDKIVVVLTHEPPWLYGTTFDWHYLAQSPRIKNFLDDYNVDLWIYGHIHNWGSNWDYGETHLRIDGAIRNWEASGGISYYSALVTFQDGSDVANLQRIYHVSPLNPVFTDMGGLSLTKTYTSDIDFDGDGVSDLSDNCPDVSNLEQEDFDGDGVGDACDNCVYHSNADQFDFDLDGIGDICMCVDMDSDGFFAFHPTACLLGNDCDDDDPEINPELGEVCDGKDNDCNDIIDDGGDILCDDGVGCTIDVCGGVAGCSHEKDNGFCDDGIFCNGEEWCDLDEDCVGEEDFGCGGFDIFGIESCEHSPDGIETTWDFREDFTSVCDEENDECTTGNSEITHSCVFGKCGSECDETHLCAGGKECGEDCLCCVRGTDSDEDGVDDCDDLCVPSVGANHDSFGCPKPLSEGFTISAEDDDNTKELRNLVLEKENVKIEFGASVVSLVRKENENYVAIDLNSEIVLGENFVEIGALEFNHPAKVSVVIAGLENPVVLKNDAKCDDCSDFIYENSVASFSVSGFSKYSVEEINCGDGKCVSGYEDCSSCSGDCGNCPSPPGGNGGGGGGGGGGGKPLIKPLVQNGSCVEIWRCSDWNECVNGTQSRICNDIGSCGTTAMKPATERVCESADEEIFDVFGGGKNLGIAAGIFAVGIAIFGIVAYLIMKRRSV